MELTESGLLLVFGSFIALVGVCFKNLRMSRCHHIKLCCGLMDCERTNLTEAEYKAELDAGVEMNNNSTTPPIIPKRKLTA